MRHVVLVVILVAATLTVFGCASTGFLGFLATTQYVDTHLKAAKTDMEAQVAEAQNDLHKTQADVRKLTELTRAIEQLVEEMRIRSETPQQTNTAAILLRGRLDQYSPELLRELADVLDAYLGRMPRTSGAGGTRELSGPRVSRPGSISPTG